MPTPAQLRAEITAGPLAAELAPLVGDDWAVTAVLNRKDRAGYVPARDVVAILARSMLWGLVPLAVHHRLLPDGSPCPPSLFGLFATVELAAYSTLDPPLRLEVGPLAAALTAIPDALIPAAVKTAIRAAEVKISRAEEVWGHGVSVTPEQVGATR